MKLRSLRVVATVASQGSLLKAAEVLGLSQPALTKSLREVEEVVGVRLFDRHARGVHPNEYGTLLADASQKILDILLQTEEGLDRIDNRVGGTVLVGALPTAAAGVVPALLSELHEVEPNIVVRVIEDRIDNLVAGLLMGDIDIVVGRLYTPLDHANHVVALPLYDEPMAFLVGAQHPLASLDAVRTEELARHPLALPLGSLRVRADTQAFLEGMGRPLHDGFTTTSSILLRELLLTRDLVAVMPWLMMKGDIDRGTLKRLQLAEVRKVPPRPAGALIRRDRALSTPASRVLEALTDYAKKHLPQYAG